MKINCVWEHNGNDTMLYSKDYIGAFTRGESKEVAVHKMQNEIRAYLRWKGENTDIEDDVNIIEEWSSELDICDADTDVIFESERLSLTVKEYKELKELALKSAKDFLKLYEAVPDKHESVLPKEPEHITFLGPRPRTAYEMYEHTKEVNSYYFGEIGIDVDNEGNIYECRKRGFDLLEQKENFLENMTVVGSFEEEWSLRKVLRRFIWHDRIHAKGMYRMAVKTFGKNEVPDVFSFDCK